MEMGYVYMIDLGRLVGGENHDSARISFLMSPPCHACHIVSRGSQCVILRALVSFYFLLLYILFFNGWG